MMLCYVNITLMCMFFFVNVVSGMVYDDSVQAMIRGALLKTLELGRDIQKPNGTYAILSVLHEELEKASQQEGLDLNAVLQTQDYGKVKQYLVDMRRALVKDPDFQDLLTIAYDNQGSEQEWDAVRKRVCHLVGYWAQIKIPHFIKQKDAAESPVYWFEKNRHLDPQKDQAKMKAAFLGQFMGRQIILNAQSQHEVCGLLH